MSRLKMWRGRAIVLGFAAVIMVALGAGSCDEKPSPAKTESDAREDAYNQIVKNQPRVDGKYSPAREAINRWKETWMQGPRLAYVYLMASNGQIVGYFILDAPPTSYCTRITRPYDWEDIPGDGDSAKVQVPAPADDAVWYTGDGSCDVYYGYEAVTSTYREWAVNGALTHFVTTQPLDIPNVQPLGITIEEVERAGGGN